MSDNRLDEKREKTNRLKERIAKLKKEKNILILAHNYQPPEIQELGDYHGDSLGLCRMAAETKANVICFCGVRFMAESAVILNPTRRVILPAPEAGCTLTDNLRIETIMRMKAEHPNAAVVCYINSSAQVKAESDICCTSANAIKVVNSLKGYDEIIFIPDRNLGHYISLYTDKRIYLIDIHCDPHNKLSKEDVLKAKEAHPNAHFIVHPECKPEVLELAEYVSSTSGMARYIKKSDAKEFIVGTEIGMVYRLRKDFPEFKFYPVSDKIICNYMKLITLEKLAESLETLTPVVELPEAIRLKAKVALDRMMEIK